MNENDFILLMEEYFDGSLPPEGRAALRRELQASPERRALFEQQSRQHIRLHAETSPLDFSESQRIAISVMDNVAAEHHPATFADILKEQTLRERLAAIREGLRAPHYSGKYRYARFALFRVFGPPLMTAALCILIITALIIAVPRMFPVDEDPEGIRIDLRVPDPTKVPDDTPPPPPSPRESPDPIPINPTLPPQDDVTTVTVSDPVPPSHIPVHPTGIRHATGKPITKPLPALLTGRSPESRSIILKKTGNTKTEQSVLKALQWLKQHQQAAGYWEGQDPVAMTGLALLTFLGHGETTDSAEFGATVQKGLQYLTRTRIPRAISHAMFMPTQ